jgi:transposase
MSRNADRQKVVNLRKQGKTYSQIRKRLGIPKSTLSDWLSKYPLTEKQLEFLKKNRKSSRQLAIEKTIIVKRKKREARIKSIYEQQRKYWVSLSQKELELAGIFLYWGEGNKRLDGSVFLNNTDPKVMKFALYWFMKGLSIPQEKIKIDLHLYSDMNVEEEIAFWSKTLDMPLSQFRKPYIKKSTRVNIDHKGFGHGTCGLVVNDVRLKERIMMAIEALADYYGERK